MVELLATIGKSPSHDSVPKADELHVEYGEHNPGNEAKESGPVQSSFLARQKSGHSGNASRVKNDQMPDRLKIPSRSFGIEPFD